MCLPLLFAIVACVGSLELGGTEQETIVPLQNTDFGSVQVHVTSPPQTFTIRPASGTQNNQVTSITENCSDFAVTAPNLPATVSSVCSGGSNCPTYVTTTYSFTATFTPAVAAQTSCVVTVVIDSTPTTFTLTGRGTEPTIRSSVSPAATLAFGEVRVGDTSSTASVLVRNFGSGPQPMTVSSVAFDAASLAKGFAVASGTTVSHVVAANGGNDPFTVTCAPTAPGPLTGSLRITTDDPAAPTTTITVSCTGVMSNLVFGPSSPALLAGTQAQKATRVGEPVDIPIAIRNTGTAAMTVHDVTIAGADLTFMSRPNPETVIPVNQSANVVLRFAAGSAVDQGTLGTLTVTHDNGQVRTINVLGAALTTTMSITPDGAVDLGPVCINNTASQTFYIVKNNPGTFKVTAIGRPEAPFQLTGMLPAGNPLAVDNNAVSFTVSVTPTAASALTGTFAVTTDIPGQAPRALSLTAIGLPDGITPTPAAMDLGTVSVGAASPGQMLVLTNCSAAPLNLIESVIGGPNQDDFEIVVPPTTTTIAPGMAATYIIDAKPNNPGGLSASLQIRYDSGMVEVPLTAAGTGDVIDTRVPVDSTYYGCSASGGSGAAVWPLGLAVVLVLRRRRRRPTL